MIINNLNSANVWDYENGFYWFSNPKRIQKIIAHYELSKKIMNVPGDILEFGVHKSLSILRFALFRNIIDGNDNRRIIGFDIFDKFPVDKLTLKSDIEFSRTFNDQTGMPLSVELIQELLLNKNLHNIELVKGNIFDTLDPFIDHNPNLKISCIHIDLDVYEPTKYVIEKLYDKLSFGGILIFDDYNILEGETLAVDEFLKINNLKVKKFDFVDSPSYLIK